MSIRHAILKCLAEKGVMSAQELHEMTGESPQRIRDNISPAVQEKLIERSMCDVNRTPVYRITDLGRRRLADGVGARTPTAKAIKPADSSAEINELRSAVQLRDEQIKKLKHDLINAESAAKMLSESIKENDTAITNVIGYACLLADGAAVHKDIDAARREATKAVKEIANKVHVVAILATAEMTVQWKEAA
jgi:DNA-binding MarR family transcriptional regulator